MRVMVQKGISFILVMVLVLGALNGLVMGAGNAHAAVAFAGGTGTSSDPYQIANADQLNEVRNHLGADFILTSDIDLSTYSEGAGWIPIGAYYDNPFYGNLNGNGFTIRNLTILAGGADYVGLFGHAANSSFTNLILEDVNVQGRYYVGGLVGNAENNANISNIYVTGNVNGVYSAGGLAGCLYGGSINNSYFIGSVTGSSYYAGGLVGYHYGDIVNSYAAGSVTGVNGTGGLIGESEGGVISNSFYDETTSGQADTGKGEGKTTVEMQTASTYTGWDFTSQWYVFEGQYPQLWAFTKLIKGTTAGTTKLFHVATGMEYSLNGNPYVPITGDSVDITVVAGDIIDVRIIAAPSSHSTLTVSLSDIRGLMPPALAADTTDNYPANDIEMTFVNDPAWLSGITAVKDGATTLVKDTQYIIEAGKLKIFAGILAKGNHSIKVTALNYDDAEIIQLVTTKTSPSLIADTTSPYPTNEIEITYTDDPTWRGVITAVNDGATTLVKDAQYTIEAGKIKIFAGVLAKGNHSITVSATNYDAAEVLQFVSHQFSGAGEGSQSSPYQIATADQLNEVRYLLASDIYFELVDDIDLGVSPYVDGEGWLPIGKYGEEFQGKLDGKGYIITGLTIARSTMDVGLFGRTSSTSSLNNMGLENINLSGNDQMGSLVGFNQGAISNSYISTGSVSGSNQFYLGGLVGFNQGAISNSYSNMVSVSGRGDIGGLVGANRGSISNSYATGSVSAINSSVGGLLGTNYPGIGQVNNSFYDSTTTTATDTGKGQGKTTELMKTESTYSGWFSSNEWGIDSSINAGYPYLKAFYRYVTYNDNGSTGGDTPIDSNIYSRDATVSVGSIGNLVRTDHIFTGWNTSPHGDGNSYVKDDTFVIKANTTLYAQWISTAKAMSTFSFAGLNPTVTGTVDEANKTIALTVPYGTDVTALVPTFTTTGASVKVANTDQVSGTTAQDFTSAVTYTVVAADSSEQAYTVTVTVAPNTAKAISTFSFAGLSPAVTGIVDEANRTVALTVPYGTDVTALVPTFTTTGASVKVANTDQVSGTTAHNFTSAVTYTVVAADSSEQDYTVTVTVAASTETPYSGGEVILPVSDAPVISTDGHITLPIGKSGEVSLLKEVTVSIPADASKQELKITIEKLLNTQNLLTKQEVLASPIFEILKNFSENFRKPVTLTFVFDPASLKSNQRAVVFYYDEVKKVWVEVGGKVNGNHITVEVDHFTKYAVMAVGEVKDVPTTAPNVSFSDVTGHWAEADIKQAVSSGIVRGYSDGTFKPGQTVTRAEFAVMLINALKPQGEGVELIFTDTAKIGAWARKAVAQAVQAGIIKGYSDGTFRPNAEITRAEMASMIAVASGQSSEANAVTGFVDDDEIPIWARGSVAYVKQAGIIQGKGGNTFAPKDNATRAEAVTVLLKLLAHIKE